MPPILDVVRTVRAHAERAYRLSIMSPRPPGYDVVTWACALLDTPYQTLVAWYEKRIKLEEARHEVSSRGYAPLFASWVIPAIPATPPPVFAAKVIDKIASEYQAQAYQACNNALAPFTGTAIGRDEKVLTVGAMAVTQCLDALSLNHGYPTYRAKITMVKDGSFKLVLHPRGDA